MDQPSYVIVSFISGRFTKKNKDNYTNASQLSAIMPSFF